MTTQTSQPPRSWKPLLVIPAAIVLAKAVAHRRMRWAAEAEAGVTSHRHGHGNGHDHGHGRRFGVQADGSVQLPPKLGAMLGAWHAQAHAADPTDSPATEA